MAGKQGYGLTAFRTGTFSRTVRSSERSPCMWTRPSTSLRTGGTLGRAQGSRNRMMNGFGLRTLAALGIIVVAGAAVFLLGDVQASLVTLIGGIAAVLAAAGIGDGDDTASSPVPAEPATPP